MKLLQQGAEAKIYLAKNPRKSAKSANNSSQHIIKIRTPKSYRHPTLDKTIRTRRTKSEAKILTKAYKAKINIPVLIQTELHNLTIEYLPGDRLSQTLNSYELKKQIATIKKLGTQVAKLHSANIIHADLTTSNTILLNKKVYLIDFGLSYISTKTEDKAVDLHLLRQALEAKHYQNAETLFKNFLKTYKDSKVIERLKIVEKRGRCKH